MNRFGTSALLVGLVGALGCKSPDSGTIRLITDEEAGTFTKMPAPTELRIVALGGEAGAVLATARLPASSIDLGQLVEASPVVSLNVQGLDSTGKQRVFGASLPLQYGALAGTEVPIFVQRDGELARLPADPTDARRSPLLAVVQAQYLLVAGGAGAAANKSTQLFDFGAYKALPSPPTLPLAPQSIALAGTVAWLIGASQTGSGTAYFDFSTSATAPLALPPGGVASDVAGGATVFDPRGAQYIVGATRAQGATDKVLKIDPGDTTNPSYPYGNTTWLTLSAPRVGASAAWMANYGLVVVGGSPTAPGVEFVGPNGTSGSALAQFPPDPTTGAGAAALDARHLLLAGGVVGWLEDAGVRDLDLGCLPTTSAPCKLVASWGALPTALGSAQAFTWSAPDDALVIGSESMTGVTHVFRVKPTGVVEVPTRAAHVNARAAWSPVGSIVLFGGGPSLESFAP